MDEKTYIVKKVCAHCMTSLIEYDLTKQEVGRKWATLALTGTNGKRCPNDCCRGYAQYVKLQIWDDTKEISPFGMH